MMRDAEKTLEVLGAACGASWADETEVRAERIWLEVSRSNEKGIYQNLSEDRFEVSVRTISGGRIGQVTGQGSRPDIAVEAIDRALPLTRYGRRVPPEYHFPRPAELPEVPTYYESTAGYSPEQRAKDIRQATEIGKEIGADLASSLQVSQVERFLVNTSGIRCFFRGTEVNVNFTAICPTSRSHAGQACRDTKGINLSRLAEEACKGCVEAQDPRELDPGRYDVVLSPYAVADLAPFLGMLVFSALADREGRSYISGRIGEPVVSSLIDLWDDATDPRGIPEPFDYEGVAKRKIQLIRKGAPTGFVHDSMTALSKGVASTGHAFPPTPAVYGPLPSNLVMSPGQQSLEELIAGVDHGLLITRFHYVRCQDPKLTLVGGVTSDGTFLIEKGQIAYPVRQMRFSESIMGALGRVTAVGNELRTVRRHTQGPGPVSIYLSTFTIPAVKIAEFPLRTAD